MNGVGMSLAMNVKERAVAANFSDQVPLCNVADARAENYHACPPSFLPVPSCNQTTQQNVTKALQGT